jgi:hypothetical protein
MDLGYPMDRPYRPIPSDLTAPAQRITTFLAGGGRAVVVTGPARAGKRALLDGLLAGMPGRVTRIENRTGLPLALDGVLKQMGKVAETEGDERGLFFRTLAEQAYDDYSAVIAVEDAHTLTSLALTALARAPGLGGPDLPGMILVLTGEAGLLEKLEGPGLEGLRNSRRTLMVPLAGPGPTAGPGPGAAAAVVPAPPHAEPMAGVTVPSDEEMGWARGNLGMRGVVIAVLAGAIAAGGGLTWSVYSHHRKPLPSSAQNAARVEAPAPPTNAAQANAASADRPTMPDALYAFLNRAGKDTAKLTPAARETLFREYQQWRGSEAMRVQSGG